MMDREKLQDAVNSKFVPVYATTKAEIVASYRDKYGSDTSKWATLAAKATFNANPGLYKSVKNARRNFEGGRENAREIKSAKGKTQWANVGKSLPPIGKKLPGDTITTTVEGQQEGGRERSWTVTFIGKDAYSFANDPTYYDFFKKLKYKDDVIKQFDGTDSSGVFVTSVS